MKNVKHSFRWLALLLLATTFLLVGTVHTAFAAGVVGNGTPASCTEAAFDAVLASQSDNVTFNCGTAVKTIVLTTTKAIDWQILIDGNNKIILQAKNVRHFDFTVQKFFTLKNLTLTNGKAENGGAIINGGNLVLTKVKFENNRATNNGGAIHNLGTLTLSKCVFTNNRAKNAGGAIRNYGGALTVTDSTFTANAALVTNGGSGGGIYTEAGALILQGGTFTKNSATFGSAVYSASGQFDVKGTKFTENNARDVGTIYMNDDPSFFQDVLIDRNTATAGGGIVSYAAVTILHSTISNNQAAQLAGGIGVVGGEDSKLIVRDSTISGNTASLGGGVFAFAEFEITNSTISNNRATKDGGGVWAGAFGIVANSTFSGNQSAKSGGAWYQGDYDVDFNFVTFANNKAAKGGGIFVGKQIPGLSAETLFSTAGQKATRAEKGIHQISLHLLDSLFATNSGGNCRGSAAELSSRGNNLSDDASCVQNMNALTDRNNTPAKLGPLANNGGPTLTHLPGKGSKAIDGGTDIGLYPLDQRGYSRPFKNSSDIGAVEVGSSQAD